MLEHRLEWAMGGFRPTNLHICSAQRLIDSLGLHLCHGLKAHPASNLIDNIGVNKVMLDKLVELCDIQRSLLVDLRLRGCSLLSQLRRYVQPSCLDGWLGGICRY
jgi:hypothetical protein